MERDKCLKRGVALWKTVFQWFLTSTSCDLDSETNWTWQAIVNSLQKMVDSYLSVTNGQCIDVLKVLIDIKFWGHFGMTETCLIMQSSA